MHVPKRVRFMGRYFTINCDSNLIEDEEVFGKAELRRNKIDYCDDAHPSQVQETVLHELFHIIDESLGLDMTEPQVHAFAAAFYAMWSDNKGMREWLAHGEDYSD